MAKSFRTYNLRNAPGILKGSMDTALKHGGLIVKQAMQERAPLWTGRMERSVEVGPVRFEEDTFSVLVGPTVDYAKYTELDPWIIGKQPGPKSQAKGATIPWMAPAAEDVRDEVQGIIVKGVSTTVHELQARLGFL